MENQEKNKVNTTPFGQAPANTYDDGNIPHEDLPQDTASDHALPQDTASGSALPQEQNMPQDIIPDEVPRKDGPGGEGQR